MAGSQLKGLSAEKRFFKSPFHLVYSRCYRIELKWKALMPIRLLTLLSILSLSISPSSEAQQSEQLDSSAAELKTVISERIKTQRQIAQSKSQWRADKSTLEFDLSRMKDELKFFKDSIQSLQSNESASLIERDQLLSQKSALEEIEKVWKERLPRLEKRVLQLAQRFPDPLARKVAPALKRIQPGSQTTSGFNSRLQAIVAIIGEADQFHSSVQMHNQMIELNGKESYQVTVIYVGLTQAFFVNEKGDLAGYGKPGSSGWTWEAQNKLGSRVQELIRIHQGELAPNWKNMPIEINQND